MKNKDDTPGIHKEAPATNVVWSSSALPGEAEEELISRLACVVPNGKVQCYKIEPPTNAAQVFKWHFVASNKMYLTVERVTGRFELDGLYDGAEVGL